MTNLTEAKLAREAEICYATLALVTDYDCWHAEEASVSVEGVVENLRRNAAAAARILRRAVRELPAGRECACGEALRNAILTDPAVVPESTRRRLEALLRGHLPAS
jgi:5'-methylthioadenosine phosphorylase